MAKEVILYNLKENVSDADYVKWCESTKGPVLLGLSSTKQFTLLEMKGGKMGNGQTGEMPKDIASPYKYIGILDCESLEGLQRDTASDAFKTGFFGEWLNKWVADFYVLVGVEVYDQMSN